MGDFMERKNNIIDTKEISKNFSKLELEKCNYYKNQYECSDEECYALIKEDRAIKTLDKACNILTTIVKIQAVITLALLTFTFIFDIFPSNNIKFEYQELGVHSKVEYDTKI